MKTQTRRILYPLAGAALGMLAGAGFGMDKGIAASAAFFGFVGFGLGYALHDFNWKRNRKTALALLLAFLTPIIGFSWLMAPHVFGLAQVAVIALTVGPAIGGLLALVVYAAANTFGLIDEAQGWPAGGVRGSESWETPEPTERLFDHHHDPVFSDFPTNIHHTTSN
ncbi:hypothetical protein [Thiobacillus sp. 65-1402]|uniref:hypothetical protein n=1 Tax=Thiobacillus sp. 65-1402 TaxID=1895861 RepID=UPI000AFD8685|nr:hypothetical protein [Thiobacillus sp. 65-1402]